MESIPRKRQAAGADAIPVAPGEGGRETGMRFFRSMAAFAAVLVVAVVAYAGSAPLPVAARGGSAASSLPGSLDTFYPPSADRPVYLLGMLGLGNSFSGIVVDLTEGDLEGARGSFADFRKRYREVADMVPEWKVEYPEGPVRELGDALAVGNREAAMKAFGTVGAICHRCHVAAMVPVQQKYHWGDFGSATVRDPMNGATVAYPEFKQVLSANLAGITVDLRQGQAENARKQYEQFRARFDALGDSCSGCHEKESRNFVDREMRSAVESLGEALRGGTVDADSVTALVQEIGRESCSKCHRVHLPAAHAGRSAR